MLANFPPTLRIPFIGASTLDSRITFSAPGTRYFYDASGVLQSVGTDTPRLAAYSLNTGKAYGILLENRSQTNIILHNRDLTITHQVGVSGGAGSFTDGETVTATGGGTGSYIADESTSTVFAIRGGGGTFTGTLTGGSSGATRTLGTVTTCWTATNVTVARDQTGLDNAANRACSLTASANNGTVLLNVSAAAADRLSWAAVKRISGSGTVQMTQDNGATWTTISITNAWKEYRIATQNVTNPTVGFRLGTSGDVIAVDLVHNTLSSNGNMPCSPIPTTTASTSSISEAMSINTLGSWFNAAQGMIGVTLYRDWDDDTNVLTMAFVSVTDGTNSNQIVLENAVSTGTGRARITVGGVSQAQVPAGADMSSDSERTVIGSYDTNSFQCATDGQAGTRDNAGSVPSGLTSISFGAAGGGGGRCLALGIYEFMVWNRPLPDGFMKARSA